MIRIATNKPSTWFYIGAVLSLIAVYVVWFIFREVDPAHAERFGIFIGIWVPTLLIAGKILEDRQK